MKDILNLTEGSCRKLRPYLKENDLSIFNEIEEIRTKGGFEWAQAVYHYIHEDPNLDLGKCIACGNRCSFKTINIGYKTYCSKKCSNSSTKEKRFDALEKNWGVRNPSQHPKILAKKKEAFLKKWGVPHINHTDHYKEKVRETSLRKYGVEHFKQSEEVKNNFRKKIKSKWGKD